MAEVVEADAQQVAHDGGEDEQCDVVARGLVVEEEADEEDVAVAPQAACLADALACGEVGESAARTLFAQRHDEAESYVDDEEECPEVELGEEQRVLVVEGEEVSQVCKEIGHARRCCRWLRWQGWHARQKGWG